MATEKRLIDANSLVEFLKEQKDKETGAYSKGRNNGINVAMEVTPDGLRWCNVWGGINGMGDEGFCNYGERKEQ